MTKQRIRNLFPWILVIAILSLWVVDRTDIIKSSVETAYQTTSQTHSLNMTTPLLSLVPEEWILKLSFDSTVKTKQDIPQWKTSLLHEVDRLLKLDEPYIDFYDIQQTSSVTEDTFIHETYVVSTSDVDNLHIHLLKPHKQLPSKSGLLFLSGHSWGSETAIYNRTPHAGRDGQVGMAGKLASEGFVVVVPELSTNGRRSNFLAAGHDVSTHENYGNVLLMSGMSLTSLHMQEATYALEFLKSQENVDEKKIGVLGLSSGGMLSLLIGALNQDVAAVHLASGAGSYYHSNKGVIPSNVLHDNLLGLLEFGTYQDVAATIVPRPLMITWGAGETKWMKSNENSDSDSYISVKKVYSMLEVRDQLIIYNHGKGHTYDVEAVISFFKTYLQ